MKFKNFFTNKSFLWILCFLLIVFFLFFLVLFFPKETYQQKKNKKTGDEDFMDILEKFCNTNFGEEWGVDHVYRYNENIMFAAIQIDGAVVDLSVQPESRAIIIENIKGKTNRLTKRVYRF